MPDWKDRSNPQFGRRRAVARRQGAVRVRPASAWQRALAVARERRPRHFAEWQASDAVCHRRRAIDFRALPRSCDPLWGGGVPPIRAWRKRRQIENVLGPLAELTALLKRPAHIVDFCASSGHVALPAAAVLKGVTVEINDLRERPIDIARERIAALPPALRARCTARVGSTETHTGPFDIGVAQRLRRGDGRGAGARLRRRAAFVLVPCCVGRLAQRANRGRNARASLPKTEGLRRLFRFTQVGGLARGPQLGRGQGARARGRLHGPRQVDGGRPGAAGLQDGYRRRPPRARRGARLPVCPCDAPLRHHAEERRRRRVTRPSGGVRVYAARFDRGTANTTNKNAHPSPASRPHIPRFPERFFRALGGEAVRQRRRRRARGPRALPPPALGDAPVHDHHARPVLASVLVDERQRGARRLLAEDRLDGFEHGGELRRVVATTQREEEVRDATAPRERANGPLDVEAPARVDVEPDRAYGRPRRRQRRVGFANSCAVAR